MELTQEQIYTISSPFWSYPQSFDPGILKKSNIEFLRKTRKCSWKGGQPLVQNWVTSEDSSPNEYELTVEKPATYCIRVIGYLDENWSDRLGGMKIDSASQQGGKAVTTLSGPLVDQAALFGVLKALYDMRMPLLSVECQGCS